MDEVSSREISGLEDRELIGGDLVDPGVMVSVSTQCKAPYYRLTQCWRLQDVHQYVLTTK